MTRGQQIQIFGLAIAVAFCGMLVVDNWMGTIRPANAATAGVSNNGIIAATVGMGSEKEVLVLLDSANGATAMYYADKSGIQFLSSRNTSFDVQVPDYNDKSKVKWQQIRAAIAAADKDK
jgi:hypothetical protein